MSPAFVVTAFAAIGLLAVGFHVVRSGAEDRAERVRMERRRQRLDVVD